MDVIHEYPDLTVHLTLFNAAISAGTPQMLLIAPPTMCRGERVPNRQLIDDSRTFAQCCRNLAERLGIRFADAGDWGISLAYDGVHFTEQGHRAFAAGLLEVLK